MQMHFIVYSNHSVFVTSSNGFKYSVAEVLNWEAELKTLRQQSRKLYLTLINLAMCTVDGDCGGTLDKRYAALALLLHAIEDRRGTKYLGDMAISAAYGKETVQSPMENAHTLIVANYHNEDVYLVRASVSIYPLVNRKSPVS